MGSTAALVFTCHRGANLSTDVELTRQWHVDDVIELEIALSDGWISLPRGRGLHYEVDAG